MTSFGGSLGGAFDLSQLKKDPTPTASPQASGPGMTESGVPSGAAETVPGPWALDVTGQNLQGMLTMSTKVPVVLAFHSEHSENSGVLVKKLEALNVQYGGRFQLGRINTDAEKEVTQAFGISAIPAAAVLLQGQPVPLFQGLPEDTQLADTIEKLLAAAVQYGITGVLDGDAEAKLPEPEIPPLHKEGLDAMERGDLPAAHDAYTRALKENPADDEAKVALHQVELLQRVQAINPEGSAPAAEQVLARAAEAELTDILPHLAAADIEFAFGRPDAAFARLIDVVRATSGDERDQVRTRLLDLFDVAGKTSELVNAARKALTSALF